MHDDVRYKREFTQELLPNWSPFLPSAKVYGTSHDQTMRSLGSTPTSRPKNHWRHILPDCNMLGVFIARCIGIPCRWLDGCRKNLLAGDAQRIQNSSFLEAAVSISSMVEDSPLTIGMGYERIPNCHFSRGKLLWFGAVAARSRQTPF